MRHTAALSPALVVADDHAAVVLTEAGARKLIGELRDCLALSDDLLVRAYTGRAWEALGYPTWEALCAAEIPQFRMLKLKTAARQERVARLRKEGATIPEMVAATNSSLGSVHRDLVKLEGGHHRAAFQTETEEAPSYAGMSRMAETLARVAAQADRGLTSLELDAETQWPLGTATANLSKLERRGLVVRVATFRRQRAAYVVTDLGRAKLEG